MLAGIIRRKLAVPDFEPFVIQMKDGRRFPVEHPDFADVSPKGSMIVVYDEEDAVLELSSQMIASEALKKS